MFSRWTALLSLLLTVGCVASTPAPTATPDPAALTVTAADLALRATAAVLGTQLALTARAPAATPIPSTSASPAPAASTEVTPAPPADTAGPTLAPTATPAAATVTFPVVSPLPASATPVGQAPVVLNFTASPAEIDPGGAITLSWEARGEQVTLWRIAADGRFSESYAVGPAGTLTVNAPASQRSPVQFVLYATTGAASVAANAAVAVRCPDVWFFPNPPAGCPQTAAQATVMQAQYFERGLMLWTQVDDRIYILYGPQHGTSYEIRANQWFAGMPESDPALVPPAGRVQPVRGFGLAWRDEQALADTRVRDRIGWALADEFSVPGAQVQCDSAARYVTCFITGPEGVVYELRPWGSGWRPWTGPQP